MKTKIKNLPKAKAKKRSASVSRKKVVIIHAKLPVLRHFRLISHKHTFKLIHHRHTSHLALFALLLIVGFFIYASSDIVQAETSSGSVLVGAIVPGPPPSVGATITSPKYGSKLIGDPITEIKGTCEKNTFVVVRDNGLTIGSINCTSAGVFSLLVQLHFGENVLSALNYDNMNQPGPETSPVTVYLSKNNSTTNDNTTSGDTPTVDTTIEVIPINIIKAVPDNPSIITGVSKLADCSDYRVGDLPVGGSPHVSIVCIPRLFLPGIQHQLGLIVWGGEPPYALNVNWGKGASVKTSEQPVEKSENTLISLSSPNYRLVEFSYAIPDTYKIEVRLKDKNGKEAIIQTAVQVNGEQKTNTANFLNNLINEPWFKSPVPFYLLAVAITLGFWGGDIFDRKYGARKHIIRTKRVA